MMMNNIKSDNNSCLLPYEGFSEVYDELMDDVPYETWCSRICSILEERGIGSGLVLDLCCGTGKMTRLMAARGYDMTGVDSSEEMLSKARMSERNGDISDREILYLCQEAAELELYGTVDAVISVCDSLNYILESEELTEVFKRVNNYLNAKGVFIFDINTQYKFREVLKDGCIAENREGVSYIWNNCYDEEEKINEYELTMFIEREEGLYEKQVEYHYERAYSIEEIKECLDKAGMELIGIYHEYEDEPVRKDSERILFVAVEGFQEGKLYMSDYMVRATAAGGQIRAFAALTTEMAEMGRKIHNTSPVMSAALGRLMTGAVMMGSMMKGKEDLLTVSIHSDGPGKGLTVTADSKGNVKGYAHEPCVILPANEKGKLDVAGALGQGTLRVIKDLGLKEPYVGQTELVSGEIAEDLTYYFAVSEQVPSCVALGVLMEKENRVKCSGGFIIQLMPDASEEIIASLEGKIKDFPPVTTLLEKGRTPEDILDLLLGDLELEILDKMPVQFACNCSRERVTRALISIGRKEIESMIEEEKDVEMNCHFCNKNYVFSTEELKYLIEEAM